MSAEGRKPPLAPQHPECLLFAPKQPLGNSDFATRELLLSANSRLARDKDKAVVTALRLSIGESSLDYEALTP
jgi:hypothetical protein